MDVVPPVPIVIPPLCRDRPDAGHAPLELLPGGMPAPAVRFKGDSELGQALSRRNRLPPATISCWRTGRGTGQASTSRCRASSSMLSMPSRGRLACTMARMVAVPGRPRLPTRSRAQMRSTADTRSSMIASWAASSTASKGTTAPSSSSVRGIVVTGTRSTDVTSTGVRRFVRWRVIRRCRGKLDPGTVTSGRDEWTSRR